MGQSRAHACATLEIACHIRRRGLTSLFVEALAGAAPCFVLLSCVGISSEPLSFPSSHYSSSFNI